MSIPVEVLRHADCRVVRLAMAIHTGKSWDDLPILADALEGKRPPSLTTELRKAAEKAAADLDEMDWGDRYDSDYSALGFTEVPSIEAAEYSVFDAATGDEYTGEG